ncbi:ABC transporter substrate-binding protein, partial [Candidatus Micrarchaeota archaeon]|nr:ABC transporter substrate-binding protein [Candidatus Micrarchaeota archaeon]
DRIDVGIVPFVHCGKVIMPVFEQNQVPLILAWDSTQEIAPGDYIFSTGFSTEAAGKKMANFAFNQLNLRKTAIAFHQDEWSEIIAPSFKQEFESLGGTIVLEEGVLVGETDFKTIIEKIKSNGVDSVYLPFVPFGTDLFLKQAKELGLEAQLLSGDAMILDIIIAAGSAAEGVYFTNIFAEDNEVSQKLSEKYHEKYEIEPEALSIVAFGYDSMMTIKNAAESVETISSETIKDALYSVDFVGAGGQIKINPNGLSDRIEKVFVVQNGEPVLAE